MTPRKANCFLLVLLILAASCDSPQMPLPGITGKAGELVIVMDDALWEASLGDTVFSRLSADVYGLPQPEPEFNVVHIRHSAFSRIFQTHRNLILFNIRDTLSSSLKLQKNVWAEHQSVIELNASSSAKAIELFLARSENIIQTFIEAEDERTIRSYQALKNDDVVAALKTDMNLKMAVPKGYSIVRSEEDFKWVRYETKDITQSLLVYAEPYHRDSTFSATVMATVMDEFTEKYIPGPVDGSFMKIYREYPVQFAETELAGVYASELRGLWDLEGGIMGGPFVCKAVLDQPRNRVIYVYGFLFAPGKDKRNYLRQTEAIMNSLQIL
jgi:hypothetical protein